MIIAVLIAKLDTEKGTEVHLLLSYIVSPANGHRRDLPLTFRRPSFRLSVSQSVCQSVCLSVSLSVTPDLNVGLNFPQEGVWSK